MSRRGPGAEPPSFFPFISVLLCILGVLIFLTGGVAATSVSAAWNNVFLDLGSGEDESKQAVVFDCFADRVEVLGTDAVFSREDVDWLWDNEKFDATPLGLRLGEIAAVAERKYVLFLVRAGGTETFRKMKQIVDFRNYELSRSTASAPSGVESSRLDELPKGLRERIQVSGRKWVVWGRITAEDAAALRTLASPVEVRKPSPWLRFVDRMVAKTKEREGKIDYGSELVPENWNIQVSMQGGG